MQQAAENKRQTTDHKEIMKRGFRKTARWQLAASLVGVVVAFLMAGVDAALSVLFGAGSVLLGSSAAVLVSKSGQPTPTAALINVLKAELIKILVVAVLLLIGFKFYSGLVSIALIGGLAGAALISGAALQAFDDDNKA
jgi:ATP synthase protein I